MDRPRAGRDVVQLEVAEGVGSARLGFAQEPGESDAAVVEGGEDDRCHEEEGGGGDGQEDVAETDEDGRSATEPVGAQLADPGADAGGPAASSSSPATPYSDTSCSAV